MRQSLMMMLTFALILTLGVSAPSVSGGSFDVPVALIKPEVAAGRVAACGFKNVRPTFDDTLQEDVVEVSDITSASTVQLRCVALASLQSHYYVTFPVPVEQTYQTLYWSMSRERDKADARAWLEKRGLLSRLPVFDPKRSGEVAFARTLESLCGPNAAGTLMPMGGMATFNKGALGSVEKGDSGRKLDEETLWCLLNAASASGYPLFFMGNEAYQPEL